MKKQSLAPVISKEALENFNPQQSIRRAKGSSSNTKEEAPKSKNLKGEKLPSKKVTKATPSIPKKMSDKIMSNLTKFNGSSDAGKPIYMSTNIIDRLNEISDKYHRRISVRAIARAVLDSFINDFNGEEIIDEYMKQIGYSEPTKEELEERNKLAEKARLRRSKSK